MCWQVHRLRDSGASQDTLSAVARRRAPLPADERGELLGEEALPGALQMQVGLQSTLAPSLKLSKGGCSWGGGGGQTAAACQATAAGWPCICFHM